jgi:hypothetical protein
MEDKKSVPEFVCDFHSPIVSRLQSAVEALQRLASHDGRFLPRLMLIGKLFAFLIDVRGVVVDVKKVSRHKQKTTSERTGSRSKSAASIPWAGSIPPTILVDLGLEAFRHARYVVSDIASPAWRTSSATAAGVATVPRSGDVGLAHPARTVTARTSHDQANLNDNCRPWPS